jgi:hypothetical protein
MNGGGESDELEELDEPRDLKELEGGGVVAGEGISMLERLMVRVLPSTVQGIR